MGLPDVKTDHIAVFEGAKEEMRAKSGKADLAPPQLFRGDTHLGVSSFLV